MELALVPLCALLLIVALAVVAAGKSRALSHEDPEEARHPRRRRRDPRWAPRRGVLIRTRQRRRTRGARIVVPPGSRRP
ncbi:MAG: hypothetical protein QOG86_2100 [Thermoleophilaceae bacterium]|jgi:hypothetical protein|nr:hypothetical protein [Thermoleophilaceae bacterium]MEA2353281.1 hypothetical protein [Thermoleophilaceae bacterium]